MGIVLQFVLLVVGFVMLVKGADWFVEGVSGIAERFGIPQLVIGLTIVAMGTSAPEAAVSITAALKGSAGITIGNIVGSNILNVLVILGVTALICKVPVKDSTVKFEIPYMIFTIATLTVMGITGGRVTVIEGVSLWVLFLVYMVYLFRMAKRDKVEATEEQQNISIMKTIAMSIVGVVLIVWGSDVTVDAAKAIATVAGLSQRFIGLTIVALGTSLPELVTSVTAAKKGKTDIAIGNIVGSNLFNILFVVGTTALITPVAFEMKFVIDSVVSLLAGVILLLAVVKHKELRRPAGIVMLVVYAGYLVYLISGSSI